MKNNKNPFFKPSQGYQFSKKFFSIYNIERRITTFFFQFGDPDENICEEMSLIVSQKMGEDAEK